MLAESDIARCPSGPSPKALVDIRAVTVVCRDEYPPARLQSHAQRRLKRSDVLRIETNDRAGVGGSDLVVHGVEDRANYGERVVLQCIKERLAAIRQVRLQEEAATSVSEGGILIESSLVGLCFVLISKHRLRNQRIVRQ